MHLGIGHAFFMIGILLLASRKADIAVAKTILFAYLMLLTPQEVATRHRRSSPHESGPRSVEKPLSASLLLRDFLCRDGFQYLHNQHLFAQA